MYPYEFGFLKEEEGFATAIEALNWLSKTSYYLIWDQTLNEIYNYNDFKKVVGDCKIVEWTKEGF